MAPLDLMQFSRSPYPGDVPVRSLAVVQAERVHAEVTTRPAEQRLTLHSVSWEAYEKILEALGEHRAAHITYDEGLFSG